MYVFNSNHHGMRYSFFSFVILLISVFSGEAQTTITGLITDSLNRPVSYASVYLSKTTYGVLADTKGIYTLTIDQNGIYELIVSSVGYKTYSQFLSADGNRQIINVKLTQNFILLKDVSVGSKYKLKLADFTLFSRLFLGETPNSDDCKIINPEDLRLFKDTGNNTLTGFSIKPLIVENRALGYSVIYNLLDFTYNLETGFLRFKGDYYFQLLPANPREIRRWARNRLSAYYGSRMNLFRSIFSDSLSSQNFKLFEYQLDSLTHESKIIKPLEANNLIIYRNQNYMTIVYNKPVLVSFTNNHSELATALTGFQPKKVISTISFSDFINIYPNGFFDNPYSITWSGELGNERVADMLPYDFQPFAKENVESTQSHNPSPVEKYLFSIQKKESTDQVFVQTDRNMYSPGDTLHFQAYVRNRFTNVFKSSGSALYAIIFNEKHIIADSSRFKINGYTASGWMTIPAEAEKGKYHFVAFTSSMQNYDPAESFGLELTVGPKSGKIKRQDVDTLSVNEDSLRLPENTYLEVIFLPEGGTFVSGLSQRIGFNATDLRGEPVYIKGLLKNKTGTILDTLESGLYGPGQFLCVPEHGMYLELINKEEKGKVWPLPDPLNKGICISVKPVDNRSFVVEIQSTDYDGDSITVAGTMNATSIFSQELLLDKKQRVVVRTDQLLPGLAQITLFDKKLRPLAERMFYINADKRLKFNIRTEKDVYEPGTETNLSVSVTDGKGNPVEGNFSISVIDSMSGHDEGIFIPGIEYTYNYNNRFSKNLPSKVLVKGLENLDKDDLDLILMVYGWTKYNWDFSEESGPETEPTNYDLLNLKILYTLRRNRADRRLDLYSLEGPSVMHLLTDKTGRISLPLDSLPEITRSVTIMPDAKNKKRVLGAVLSIPYNQKYLKSSKLIIPQPAITFNDFHVPSKFNSISLGSDVIPIPEVKIIGHQVKRVYHDQYEKEYQYADVRSLDYNLLWTSFSVTDALYRLITPYYLDERFVILRRPTSFFGGPVVALIVLDGMPLYFNGWGTVRSLPASEITSLTVMFGSAGYARYGSAAQAGVIFVNTRSSDPSLQRIRTDWKLQHYKNKILLPISLFRPEKEFYKPTKFDIENNALIQRQSTIFWQSDVYFNGKEPSKISYYNLKHNGPVIITINGVSYNNLVGTGHASYTVE